MGQEKAISGLGRSGNSAVIDDPGKIPQSFEALLFSMYYAAVSSCTAREVRQRFGERQDVLMKRYGRSIEAALGNNYDVPALETLQALVLYIVSGEYSLRL